MTRAIAFLAGGLFGVGVCISGMVRPSKVLGFLDLGGAWDPSLAFVMAAALALHVYAWRMVARRSRPRFGRAFPGPPPVALDRSLWVGAVVFGVGWGLSGYCPGPAVVSVVSGATPTLVFVAAMLVGMLLHRQLARPHAGSDQ